MTVPGRILVALLSAILLAAPATAYPGGPTDAQEADDASMSPAEPPEDASVAPWRTEWAVVLGGATGTVFDAARTDTDLLLGGVRWGRRLGGRPGPLSFLVEVLPVFTVAQQPRAWGGGLNLLLRYTAGTGDWRPAVIGGVGLLVADETVPPGETHVNFTPQIGAGLRRMLADDVALTLEYRFHHLSNAGLSEANPGINSHMGLIVVSWFR